MIPRYAAQRRIPDPDSPQVDGERYSSYTFVGIAEQDEEESAIGNILVQYMALGQIGSLQEARSIVKHSFPIITFEPEDSNAWNEGYSIFQKRTQIDSIIDVI